MTDSPYLAKTTGTKLIHIVLFTLLLQIILMGVVYIKLNSDQNNFEVISTSNAKALVDNNRKSCELGKLASQNLADFETAHSVYITTVTGAKSVKEDVKRAARKALKVFSRTSRAARIRAHRDCAAAFPYNTQGF